MHKAHKNLIQYGINKLNALNLRMYVFCSGIIVVFVMCDL